MPVWNVLEQSRFGLELPFVNPAAENALPGEKSDAKDAARIAELHQYVLLRGSFIPPRRSDGILAGRQQEIHAERDRKLDEARKQRPVCGSLTRKLLSWRAQSGYRTGMATSKKPGHVCRIR